ncbi:hypothetical protein QWY86_03225 [Pedobacter aquatilis]|uniref:hypothetical protein n=1 Tax=Pedobacter aquatilis TaxID=351343 RepID=UPI0025B34317|nr:hypothetical protein [Pedobacter aquatilis]MDN3585663.1 hypothetical protein [Pedobacter aquatilis]
MDNLPIVFAQQELGIFEKEYNFCAHERKTFEEIQCAIVQNDVSKLRWFAGFGDRLRAVLLNVHAYRMGLGFGFEKIDFDVYGWLLRPAFLDVEELRFGLADKSRYGNYSSISLGHGPNGIWTYGMSISYGTAGSACGLSVYGPVFSGRQQVLDAALVVLKGEMEDKVGNKDTTNYHQKVILATLKSIEETSFGQVQLSLF